MDAVERDGQDTEEQAEKGEIAQRWSGPVEVAPVVEAAGIAGHPVRWRLVRRRRLVAPVGEKAAWRPVAGGIVRDRPVAQEEHQTGVNQEEQHIHSAVSEALLRSARSGP